MSAFIKFLVSMVAHLIWQRVGGRGAIPPVRLPRAGKPVTFPAVSTWQLMIAMWMLKKFWAQYGGDVKTRMTGANHPIPRRIGTWLPDTDTPAAAAPSTTQTTPPPTAAPAAPPNYNTQQLADDAANSGSSGSLLSSLRGAPSGSSS